MEDFDINSFKTEVINRISENNEIVYLLDEDYIDCGGGLLYKKLFPYPQNPTTVKITSPFICVKVDHIKNKDVYLEEIDVIVYVICHEKEMTKKVQSYKTKEYISGTIIDIIGELLKQELAGLDTHWIGKLSCGSNTEEVLFHEYPCRVITFSAYSESYGHY